MADKPIKQPILGVWSKTALWTLAIMAGLIYLGNGGPKTPEEESAEAAKAQKEQMERARNNVMRQTYLSVRSNLRDPDSMQVELMLASAKPESACIAYRARNGFSGMVRDIMVWDGKKYAKTAVAWKKTCDGPHLEDITYLEGSMDSSYRRRHR